MNDKKIGRGRPRAFDVDAAVQTAQHLFQQHGYGGVSIAMLSQTLGIAPPSLYAAFGSKAALFAHVVERYLQTEGAFVTDALEDRDGATAIRRLLHGAAASYAAQENWAGCLIMNGVRACDDAAAVETVASVRRLVRGQIMHALARHLPNRAEEVTDLIGTAMAGMSAAALDGADRDCLDRFATLVSDAILTSFDLGAGDKT